MHPCVVRGRIREGGKQTMSVHIIQERASAAEEREETRNFRFRLQL